MFKYASGRRASVDARPAAAAPAASKRQKSGDALVFMSSDDLENKDATAAPSAHTRKRTADRAALSAAVSAAAGGGEVDPSARLEGSLSHASVTPMVEAALMLWEERVVRMPHDAHVQLVALCPEVKVITLCQAHARAYARSLAEAPRVRACRTCASKSGT